MSPTLIGFADPNGRLLDTVPPADRDAHGLARRNREHGIAVDARTVVGAWHGDPLDLDLTITGLLCLDRRLGKGAADP